MKKAIQLTSAMNKASITIDVEDLKCIQNVSTDSNQGNAKVFTANAGNFYVNQTEDEINKVVFPEVQKV